ncbi:MAG: glycosyl hydrolase family 38 [Dysgonamonadaceae bacterium]|jgi:hypothetical protein|nr:glycosyl hydrolase family 38 [Dysgonamonadaceae bacterium]
MKAKKIGIMFIICVCVAATDVCGQEKDVSTEVRMLPALYRATGGAKQVIELKTVYEGDSVWADISAGNRTQKEKLVKGKNRFLLEIPAVEEPKAVTVAIEYGTVRKTVDVAVKPVRRWQLNYMQHTHTDIGYTRPQTEILAEHLRYIDYALDYCDATDGYPENARFRWTCEVSWAVSEYIKTRPAEQVAHLRKRVAERRIELAAMYLNFDELPDERMLAASLQPLGEFRRAGMKSEIAMQNDVNGIGWCFAEYFADMGVKYVNMGIHGHRALLPFDKPAVFWWESPSGKKILACHAEMYLLGTYFGVASGNFAYFEERTLGYLSDLETLGYQYDIAVLPHSGYITDNSSPSTNISDLIRQWNDKYEYPKLRTAVASDFFREIESRYADSIPTIRGAWPDWWTDGFASGAREAAALRIANFDAGAIQTCLSFAKISGSKIPDYVARQQEEINRSLLFYGEHTLGYSESVRDPYGSKTWEQRSLKQSYAWEAYRRSGTFGEAVMGLLQSHIPKTAAPSIAVFNTLNWSYSGIAKAYIDHRMLPPGKKFEIVDSQGRVLPAQAGESRSDGTYWSIYVRDIPPLGYAQYSIHVKDEPADLPDTQTELKQSRVENEWYIVDFNKKKGTISQLFDKELNKPLLTSGAQWELGEFIYEIIDSRSAMEKYSAPQSLRRPPEKMRFDRFERGPVWDTYRFVGETAAGREPDNLTVEYRLHSTSKRVEIVYSLRKKSVTDPEAVYISFPFEAANGKIHLDVPGGTIEAGKDQIPGSVNDWYTVQNFASALSDSGQTVISSREIPLMQFGAINTGRYIRDAVPQSANMYSWPMNNYWTTNFNADQMGGTVWSYVISSSSSNTVAYSTRFSRENNIPLLTRVLPASVSGKTDVTPPVSLLEIMPQNLLLVTMIPVAGENAAILQLREIEGKPARLNIVSGRINIRKISVCDATGSPLPNSPAPEFKPLENKFVKISW